MAPDALTPPADLILWTAYTPFGPRLATAFANDLREGREYDLDGRITSYAVEDSALGQDVVRRIDKTEWSGDHQKIKRGIGAGPKNNVRISPDGDVWAENPDGSWTDYGPAEDYTGSGRPSGGRGKDRDKW